MTTLNGGTAKKGGCLEVCAEEEANLRRTHVIYTEMKTLGFVWHIFVFIISENQSSGKKYIRTQTQPLYMNNELKRGLFCWLSDDLF